MLFVLLFMFICFNKHVNLASCLADNCIKQINNNMIEITDFLNYDI